MQDTLNMQELFTLEDDMDAAWKHCHVSELQRGDHYRIVGMNRERVWVYQDKLQQPVTHETILCYHPVSGQPIQVKNADYSTAMIYRMPNDDPHPNPLHDKHILVYAAEKKVYNKPVLMESTGGQYTHVLKKSLSVKTVHPADITAWESVELKIVGRL